MQHYRTRLEKLRQDAAECAFIRDQAIDKAKQELFGQLADHLNILADQVETTLKDAEGRVSLVSLAADEPASVHLRFGRMDPAVLQQHLALAERNAAEGRRIVARQEAVVADLDRRGRDITGARKVLDTLRDTQAVHEQDVRRLREEMNAATQPLSKAGRVVWQ